MMRSVGELLKNKVQREDMTTEEHVRFVNYWFDKYESEGFSKIFCSPFDLKGNVNRNGEQFEVVDRVKAYTGSGEIGEDEADIETLPMWNIRFSDGETMSAYPEEIIPSEIKDNVWREEDKKLLSKL